MSLRILIEKLPLRVEMLLYFEGLRDYYRTGVNDVHGLVGTSNELGRVQKKKNVL